MNIPPIRLFQQKIIQQDLSTPQEVVAYMGAIQAQDFPMSRWAIGLRLPKSNDAMIEKALNDGQLVRTHVLRPTWHIVSGQDVRWMLALSAKNIKTAMASYSKDLGIDASTYVKTNDLIVKALEGGKSLTRQEVMNEIEKCGVKTDSSRAVHFMMNAEVDAIVCSGIPKGKELTYTLLDEKVPKGIVLNHEEALSTLAKRFFTSHAPATLQDFYWWSGLSMPDARLGLESIKNELKEAIFDGRSGSVIF
jgi:Winged helix DNA-binding domain